MKSRIIAFLGAALFSCAVSASGLGELESFLSGTVSARGLFTQNDAAGGEPMSGSFSFLRPGMFTWIYEKPYRQEIHCDGRTMSVWDPDLQQVTVRDVRGTLPSSPASILFGGNDFRRDFDVREAGVREGIEWVEARPKSGDGAFELARIGFRGGSPVSVEVRNGFGQEIRVSITGLERNPALKADDFKYTPPEGAEILRE